jgi:hypothetical protein
MNPMKSQAVRHALTLLAVLALAAGQAVAGPPLICHPFDIGDAKSLPWISHDWNLTGQESYDTRNLAADTLAILDSSLVTLVHMETLRRATLYARKDPAAGKQLLAKLVSRAEASENSPKPNALAIFDAGYLAETYQQWLGEGGQNPAHGLDGTVQVKKALALRPDDAQVEFAAALVGLKAPAADNQEHVQKAIAGSKTDPLLARNLSTHFLGSKSRTMAEMIARNSSTKVAKQ